LENKPRTCKFCGKSFKRERTLASHVCEPKRRHADSVERYWQLAFRTYQKFYKYNYPTRNKDRTKEQFIKSQYYSGFIKFGRFLSTGLVLNHEKYVEYVIRNAVKLERWSSDAIYDEYLKEHLFKETVDRAAERMMLHIMNWASDHDQLADNFFNELTSAKALLLIRNGTISPWIIYGTHQGEKIIDSMSDEQLDIVVKFIDPRKWKPKIKMKQSEAKWLKDIFNNLIIQDELKAEITRKFDESYG
jgi:hypothetical protein|tara:strand:- start:20 stop:757 length:738 start_codon:yes stop_codon:yes gene_type:complete